MPVFKLILSYDGASYAGWQVQNNALTIQAVLERAIHQVTGETVRATASGRTDSGVHAFGQVASFACSSKLSASVMQRALNAHLPDDIRILDSQLASDSFHPIYDCLKKRYRYIIQDGPIHGIFERKTSWHVPVPLDVDAMRQAAQHLVGEHDFASFQAAGSDRKTTVRTVYELLIEIEWKYSVRHIQIDIEANGFLYNMVRNIVGTLVEVGRSHRSPDSMPELIAKCNRSAAGMTAPAQGLFLVDVTYPELTSDH